MHELLGIHFEPNILAVIGLIIAVSFLGSKLFQRFGVPQVVGFIVIGVILGPSVLNLVPLELSSELIFISEIALGLIGFDIGSHLLLGELRRLGRSILFILLFEAVGTFLLVAAGIYLFTQSLHTALIFGALASATEPGLVFTGTSPSLPLFAGGLLSYLNVTPTRAVTSAKKPTRNRCPPSSIRPDRISA